MLLGLLALALPLAAVASSTDPITINFGVVPIGGTPSFVGPSLNHSTAFNFGGGTYLVNVVGSGDQSGLTVGDTVTLSNPVVYGHGTSGPISLTKSWSSPLGPFVETFSSFTANRTSRNAITLELSGTLSGPSGVTEPVVGILSANQAGGHSHRVSWTLTEEATGVTVIPEPGTLGMLGTGLIGLAGLARRKLKL
jgi:hypothetical protein